MSGLKYFHPDGSNVQEQPTEKVLEEALADDLAEKQLLFDEMISKRLPHLACSPVSWLGVKELQQ